MSRFNTLYLGEPERVVEELESETETTTEDLRIALINAMSRIDKLEREAVKLPPSSGTPSPESLNRLEDQDYRDEI